MSQIVDMTYYATYSGKSDSEIDTYRDDQLADCLSENVTGTFVIGEGNTWIRLQGEHSDCSTVGKAIEANPFFDSVESKDLVHLQHVQLDEVYLYHEGRTPVTS